VIVADNSLIVEAIRFGLRKSGEFHLVGHAHPARTSASAIVAVRPDAVLIDDIDRSACVADLIRDLRIEDAHLSMIVLSAEMDRDWLEHLFNAGATGAISKSTHPAALGTLLRETLNGHIFHKFVGSRTANNPAGSLVSEDSPLTGRETEILQLVAAGATNGDVARNLWVTEQTVKFHLRNIYRKLEVTNRTEASHFAHVNGLLSPGAALRVAS
jgi:DNA-binding NarL/FixJ family response regulator